MVIAVGVAQDGYKHLLGFVQTSSENERVISQFLGGLLDRGLDISQGLLSVIDGAKGLRAALRKTFRDRVLIQRCQWHKRENVVSYLAKGEQKYWRGRLQRAYQRPTYAEAKRELEKIRAELSNLNESAVASLDEGLEETLTLHRLGVFALLGKSLKTTNIIESINAQAEERCGKVDYWKNSNQKQRWLVAALLDIEPRLRRLAGYRHLPVMREAIMRELELHESEERSNVAA
jgi:putative transposase